MSDKNEANEVIVVENNKIVDVDTALREWEAYQELTEKLLDESDYQQTKNGSFKKKSAWRKYGRAFKISDKILEKEIVRDEEGRVISADFVVRAWTQDGREGEGIASCDKWENKQFNKNHDIISTAHTRAKNRAISDMIGAGEVSAEELGQLSSDKKSIKKGRRPQKAMKKVEKDEKPPKPVEPENTKDAEFKKKEEKIFNLEEAVKNKTIQKATQQLLDEKGVKIEKITPSMLLKILDKFLKNKKINQATFNKAKTVLGYKS